jgi:hypothetical protein
MTLPAGWPDPAAVETLPTVWLALDGSAWPPAADGRPAGTVPVASWSVERELVGSVLPGNVRARSGLSIGSAQATVAQMAVEPLAPWAADASRRVVPGAAAALYATHDGHDDAARVNLGDWVVAPASGSLLSPGVDLELLERPYMGRAQDQRLPPLSFLIPCDPIWPVSVLAAQVGYHSVPPPIEGAIWAAPFTGSPVPVVGSVASTAVYPGGLLGTLSEWGTSSGAVGFAEQALALYTFVLGSLEDAESFLTGDSLYLTFNVEGAAQGYGARGGVSPGRVEVDGNTLTVREGSGTTPSSVTFTRGLDPAHPKRVQVEMQAIFTGSNWTGFRARARSAHDAPWSSWATRTYAAKTPGAIFQLVFGTINAASSVSGAQLTRRDAPALWAAPNADFVPLGGRLDAPFLPAETDAWTGIQEFCASNLGAAWVTRDRVLMVRGRDWLAGAGRPAEPLDVGQSVEDLSWTVDPGDTADRLEVTYQPIDWELPSADTPPAFPVLWQADDVIELGPRQTVEIIADLDGPASHIYGPSGNWVPAWFSASLVNEFSVWSALPNRDGTGAQPANDALVVSARALSVSRAVVTIRNTTGLRLFTVDRAGSPCIIWRSPRVGRLGNTAVVERGAPESKALNPLRIDLGAHVQRDVDAEAIADYIWSRVSSQMWRADAVRVRLDWGRDIGDVVELTHERSGLSVKALVTKVGYSGQPGEVAQTLDLVLLPPTWADWDARWETSTWGGGFDPTWAGSLWSDFDVEPLR